MYYSLRAAMLLLLLGSHIQPASATDELAIALAEADRQARHGEIDSALSHLYALLPRYSDRPAIFNALARLYARRGDLAAAEAAINQAIALQHDVATLLENYRQIKQSQARVAYARALQLDTLPHPLALAPLSATALWTPPPIGDTPAAADCQSVVKSDIDPTTEEMEETPAEGSPQTNSLTTESHNAKEPPAPPAEHEDQTLDPPISHEGQPPVPPAEHKDQTLDTSINLEGQPPAPPAEHEDQTLDAPINHEGQPPAPPPPAWSESEEADEAIALSAAAWLNGDGIKRLNGITWRNLAIERRNANEAMALFSLQLQPESDKAWVNGQLVLHLTSAGWHAVAWWLNRGDEE
jgi:hypothetical protein